MYPVMITFLDKSKKSKLKKNPTNKPKLKTLSWQFSCTQQPNEIKYIDSKLSGWFAIIRTNAKPILDC